MYSFYMHNDEINLYKLTANYKLIYLIKTFIFQVKKVDQTYEAIQWHQEVKKKIAWRFPKFYASTSFILHLILEIFLKGKILQAHAQWAIKYKIKSRLGNTFAAAAERIREQPYCILVTNEMKTWDALTVKFKLLKIIYLNTFGRIQLPNAFLCKRWLDDSV